MATVTYRLPIFVVWFHPQHTFYVRFPELKGTNRKIIFITSLYDIDKVRGYRNQEFILDIPEISLHYSIIQRFKEFALAQDFKPYEKRAEVLPPKTSTPDAPWL